MNRIVADVPVHDLVVGTGEGQVDLKKLRTTMLKLPRVLTGPQVTATNDRLRALGDLEQHAAAEGADAEGHEAAEGRAEGPLTPRTR
ncbi:hypothetical protein SPURM210S_01007 [Streptomyces purpurascens]